MQVKSLSVLVAVASAAVLAAAVTSASAAPANARKSAAVVRISTRAVPGLGRVLVDSKGRTLYMFAPDKRKRVTCVSTCARIWPPVFLPKGAKAVGTGGVKAALLGSDADPAGGRVVTYHGWPLYLYLGDHAPGTAFGQALNLNGGLWYVLTPAGTLITKKWHAGGSTSGSGSGSTSGSGSSAGSGSGSATGGKSCAGASDADGDGDEDAGGPDDGDGCL